MHKTNLKVKTPKIKTQKVYKLKKTIINKRTFEKPIKTAGELHGTNVHGNVTELFGN